MMLFCEVDGASIIMAGDDRWEDGEDGISTCERSRILAGVHEGDRMGKSLMGVRASRRAGDLRGV